MTLDDIPPASRPFLVGVDFSTARDLKVREIFTAADRKNRSDPSKCAWMVELESKGKNSYGKNFKAVAWMAGKLAIDADGKAAGEGYKKGTQLDPASGQNDTSLHFADGTALSSEGCPYYVLPGGTFGRLVGLSLGDVGIVIYRYQITVAVLGDIGPKLKIGEGSIRLHNRLRPAAPDPCPVRDSGKRCVRIRNASIENGVIFIGFPGTKIDDLALETSQEQVEERAFALFQALQGIS